MRGSRCGPHRVRHAYFGLLAAIGNSVGRRTQTIEWLQVSVAHFEQEMPPNKGTRLRRSLAYRVTVWTTESLIVGTDKASFDSRRARSFDRIPVGWTALETVTKKQD